jgi:hypothetical protein
VGLHDECGSHMVRKVCYSSPAHDINWGGMPLEPHTHREKAAASLVQQCFVLRCARCLVLRCLGAATLERCTTRTRSRVSCMHYYVLSSTTYSCTRYSLGSSTVALYCRQYLMCVPVPVMHLTAATFSLGNEFITTAHTWTGLWTVPVPLAAMPVAVAVPRVGAGAGAGGPVPVPERGGAVPVFQYYTEALNSSSTVMYRVQLVYCELLCERTGP